MHYAHLLIHHGFMFFSRVVSRVDYRSALVQRIFVVLAQHILQAVYDCESFLLQVDHVRCGHQPCRQPSFGDDCLETVIQQQPNGEQTPIDQSHLSNLTEISANQNKAAVCSEISFISKVIFLQQLRSAFRIMEATPNTRHRVCLRDDLALVELVSNVSMSESRILSAVSEKHL